MLSAIVLERVVVGERLSQAASGILLG
jgi:hypothetical protein